MARTGALPPIAARMKLAPPSANAVFDAALIGHQRQRMAAAQQLFGQCLGRKHVAPGAAGGEDDGTAAH